MKRIFRRFPLLLLLSLCFTFTGCGGDATDLLAYQAREMRLAVSYERGGVTYAGEVWLAAGGEGRDLTVTYTSPETVRGVCYGRTNGTVSASYGAHTVAADEDTLLPLSLFSIPRDAKVMSIDKTEEGRTAVLAKGETVYTLRFRGDGEIPYFLSCESGGAYLALTVEKDLSSALGSAE